MICPSCGAVVSPSKVICDSCGYDFAMKKKAHKLACYYYNRGLERAQLRDLTGAIDNLTRSVELEKDFIDARNLLGLCYFEIGEVGSAISHWIISKNFKEINPTADRYLATVQNNSAKLNHYRSAIRKYNNGLKVAKQGGDDLALIQLKKAVQYNPDYVKAWQLLAIIYMKNEDYDRARKCLKRSLKTDIANPTSLRYMKAIKDIRYSKLTVAVSMMEKEADDRDAKIVLDGHTKQNITPVKTYREDGPDYRVFVSLFAGVLIGMMVVYFLVVPGIRQSMKLDQLSAEKKTGEEVAQYLSELDSLETENASLQSKIEMLDLAADDYKEQIEGLKNEKYYDNVLHMVRYYEEITANGAVPNDFQLYMLKQKVQAISQTELATDSSTVLYNLVLAKYPDLLTRTYSGEDLLLRGKQFLDAGDNPNANEMLQLSYNEAPDNEETLYLLGRSYQLIGDTAKARQYYNEYISKYPTGQFLETVNQWLATLG